MKQSISIGSVAAVPGQSVSGKLSIGNKPASEYSIPLTVINGKDDGPILTIISGQHGTEYVGIGAAIEIIRRINPTKLSGAILVLPVVNAAGFEQRSRLAFPVEDEFSGTRNLNRIWPGDPNGSLAQKTMHVVFNQVVKKGQYMFDIHGGDLFEYCNPVAMISKTGNSMQDGITTGITEAIGYDYVLESSLAKDVRGISKTEAVLAGITTVVMSAGEAGRLEEKMVEKIVTGIMNALKYLKMIEGAVTLRKDYRVGYEIVKIKAKAGGLFYQRVPVGTVVHKGQELGEIISMGGETLEKVQAVDSGLLFESCSNPAVNSGETLGEIALLRA
jgi:predicted deacylase